MKIFTLSVVTTFTLVSASQKLVIGDLSYCKLSSCTDRSIECKEISKGKHKQWVKNTCARGHQSGIQRNREWFGECCKTCCDVLESLKNKREPDTVKTTTTTAEPKPVTIRTTTTTKKSTTTTTTSEAPTTGAPITEAPTTAVPTTAAPTTAAPTTEPPATNAPTTKESSTEANPANDDSFGSGSEEEEPPTEITIVDPTRPPIPHRDPTPVQLVVQPTTSEATTTIKQATKKPNLMSLLGFGRSSSKPKKNSKPWWMKGTGNRKKRHQENSLDRLHRFV